MARPQGASSSAGSLTSWEPPGGRQNHDLTIIGQALMTRNFGRALGATLSRLYKVPTIADRDLAMEISEHPDVRAYLAGWSSARWDSQLAQLIVHAHNVKDRLQRDAIIAGYCDAITRNAYAQLKPRYKNTLHAIHVLALSEGRSVPTAYGFMATLLRVEYGDRTVQPARMSTVFERLARDGFLHFERGQRTPSHTRCSHCVLEVGRWTGAPVDASVAERLRFKPETITALADYRILAGPTQYLPPQPDVGRYDHLVDEVEHEQFVRDVGSDSDLWAGVLDTTSSEAMPMLMEYEQAIAEIRAEIAAGLLNVNPQDEYKPVFTDR